MSNTLRADDMSIISTFPQDSEGQRAMPVLIKHSGQTASLVFQDLTATTGYVLVKLTPGSVWKHTATNTIHIDWLSVDLNPGNTFRGDVYIGFLSGTTTTTGDLNILKVYHFEQAATERTDDFLSFIGSHLECSTDNWVGPMLNDDALFGTTDSVTGPDGTSFNPANSDLCIKVTRTAGNLDGGITVGYHTT